MARRIVLMVRKEYMWFFVFVCLLIWAIYGEYSLRPAVLVIGGAPIYRGNQDHNQAALTFNVDWGEAYLPAILARLEENEVQATFFITGNWAQKHPHLVKEIYMNEHELGNHGYHHKNPQHMKDSEIINLIKNNEALLQDITGYKTKLFAPPYGAVDTRVARVAAGLGYKTIMWTVDTIDWQRPAPEVILGRVLRGLEPGAIILAHPTKPTLEALPLLIKEVQNRGYQLVTVSQILN